MNNNPPSKCANCGAGLVPAGENLLKCSYCGSLVTLSAPSEEVHKPEPPPQQDQATVATKPQTEPTENKPESGGCAAVFIISAILLVFILIGISKRRIDDDNAAREYSLLQDRFKREQIADSLSRDSLKKDRFKQLSLINLDTVTFKKLYKAAHKERNADEEVFIYDPVLYRDKNDKVIDAYVFKGGNERRFYFGLNYRAEELLHIQTVTFNVDGKIYRYEPTFSTYQGDTEAWEQSNDVIENPNLSMVVHIALSRKTEMKYNGTKHHYVIMVSKMQKAVLKRQLQIYKGLLLEYDQ